MRGSQEPFADIDTKGMITSETRSQLCPLNNRGHNLLTYIPAGGASTPPKPPGARGGDLAPPVPVPARAPRSPPPPRMRVSQPRTARARDPEWTGLSHGPYQGMALSCLSL